MVEHSYPDTASVRDIIDREEKYLLEHFDAECGIMPGDVQGSFHRICEAISAVAQAPSYPETSDPYEEAALILSAAKQMFEEHSLSVTGNKWDFSEAGEQVRAIWIIKATRDLAQAPAYPETDYALRGEIADAIREYCHSISPHAVQDSHGTARIYYSGISLDGLTDAIFAAMSRRGAAAQAPRAWPRVFNVRRSAMNAWHGEISFARWPADAELQALEVLLRDDHLPAPTVPPTDRPPLNKKSKCPACNLLEPCTEPGCPNAISSTSRATPAWPAGCHDPDSCSRHYACMYVQCKRHGTDGNEVAAEIIACALSSPSREGQS